MLGGDTGLGSLVPWAIALLVAAALVVGGFTVLGRRAGASVADPALAGVPLAVEGLGKRYADGFRAVSDLTFRVERGGCSACSGPNGAGKTTALRMLMGLIAPTEGGSRSSGTRCGPARPCCPGSGPSSRGRASCRTCRAWRTCGCSGAPPGGRCRTRISTRRWRSPGSGTTIHRRVKTYSQGMRQRLAIAQAMLGLPDLLVLDEPTNGLDPPQIREMREVLRRYAATGRTVVISSHLLAEVEQTCDHVVVMHQGRLVAAGPGRRAGRVGVRAGRGRRRSGAGGRGRGVARRRARGRDDADGDHLKLVGTPRSELVRVLVADGLAVDRIAPQRGLEEAFLALVGEG